MKNENFIIIQGWMINELKLKGNRLLLYAMIYGFSQDGLSSCRASISYICNGLNISKQTAIDTAKSLIEDELITKEIVDGVTSYKVVKKLDGGSQETRQVASQEIRHNNNINNNNINISITEKEILELYDYYISNIGLDKKYHNKSKSIQLLKKEIKENGIELVKKGIDGYFSSTEKKYRIALNKLLNLSSLKGAYYKDFIDIKKEKDFILKDIF